jgi:organic radical activating enzyme
METKCLAASHNLFLDSNGDIKLCCNSNMPLDNASSIESAITGPIATEIQTALANNQPHKNCTTCWYEQKTNSRSYRDSYNSMYPTYNLLSDRNIKTIHVQYDNTCNLTCVYCGPQYSSKWSDLLQSKQPFRQPVMFDDASLASLDMITLAGGEPSLVKSNIELLDRLYSINPDCHIFINSNLTNVKNNPVFERLYKFSKVTVIASFEAIDKRYEYIRNGAKWSDFSTNFSMLADHVQEVQASMIFFPLSASTIHLAVDRALETVSVDNVYINNYEGSSFTWEHIEQSKVDMLRESVVKSISGLDKHIQDQILPKCELMVSTQTNTSLPTLDQLDRLTNQNHKHIFTELYF